MQLNFYNFVRDTIFLEPLERNVDLVVQLVGKPIFFKTKSDLWSGEGALKCFRSFRSVRILVMMPNIERKKSVAH